MLEVERAVPVGATAARSTTLPSDEPPPEGLSVVASAYSDNRTGAVTSPDVISAMSRPSSTSLPIAWTAPASAPAVSTAATSRPHQPSASTRRDSACRGRRPGLGAGVDGSGSGASWEDSVIAHRPAVDRRDGVTGVRACVAHRARSAPPTLRRPRVAVKGRADPGPAGR